MSPSGPFYATSASAGADWSTVSNATGAPDGNLANNSNEGPGAGGHIPTQLITSGHGFSIPSTAIIDGILVEAKVYGDTGSSDNTIQIGKTGKTSTSNPTGFGHIWPSPLAFISWGSATDKWGRTDWTPADINDSSFGASLSAFASHSTGTISIDSVRITVYWHPAPADVPISYIYQVFNSGQYLGDLPNVTSPFTFSQDINTAGSQITIHCGVSPDTIAESASTLLDENGVGILDENGNAISDEGVAPIMQLGNGSGGAIVRNGNKVIVTQVDYWNPNGKVVFQGTIQHWEGDFGGDSGTDDTMIMVYSDGADLDNHLVKGPPFTYTLDQNQNTQNTQNNLTSSTADMGTSWTYFGQTFTTGSGVTSVGAIALYLSGSATVTITLYDSPSLTTTMGTVTQSVTASGSVQFNFPSSIPVVALTQYFFTVTINPGQLIYLYSQNTNPYSGGQMYTSVFAGGGGGTWTAIPGSDLYFQTYSSNGATTATYSSVDPTTGMLAPIMNYYIAEGGLVTYNPLSATGLSISYKWNTNTIYEGLQGTLSVCPNGYYYTVDVGSSVLTFKAASNTADITLIKGFHMDKMTLVATIEQIVNSVFFTGGSVSGSNIYTTDKNQTSINRYGVHLDRPTNNQVLDTTTAHAIGSAEVAQLGSEQYSTKVSLAYHKIDFTTVKPGMVVGFAGFGNFIDQMLLQIVRIDYTPWELTLTLGLLPRRLHKAVEQTVRGYVGLQTVGNPTSPS